MFIVIILGGVSERLRRKLGIQMILIRIPRDLLRRLGTKNNEYNMMRDHDR